VYSKGLLLQSVMKMPAYLAVRCTDQRAYASKVGYEGTPSPDLNMTNKGCSWAEHNIRRDVLRYVSCTSTHRFSLATQYKCTPSAVHSACTTKLTTDHRGN
jgi:hypothetical protein